MRRLSAPVLPLLLGAFFFAMSLTPSLLPRSWLMQGILGGLVAALSQHAHALEARHGLKVHASLHTEPALAPEVQAAVYRVAQEALHNVVKHAHATQVWLSLQETAQAVCLSVRDDGRGFDPEAQGRGTLGQRSMRERAAGIGADLQVSSAPGQGTQVTLTLHRAAQTMPTPAEASEVSA